jgi:hypothetical protein
MTLTSTLRGPRSGGARIALRSLEIAPLLRRSPPMRRAKRADAPSVVTVAVATDVPVANGVEFAPTCVVSMSFVAARGAPARVSQAQGSCTSSTSQGIVTAMWCTRRGQRGQLLARTMRAPVMQTPRSMCARSGARQGPLDARQDWVAARQGRVAARRDRTTTRQGRIDACHATTNARRR